MTDELKIPNIRTKDNKFIIGNWIVARSIVKDNWAGIEFLGQGGYWAGMFVDYRMPLETAVMNGLRPMVVKFLNLRHERELKIAPISLETGLYTVMYVDEFLDTVKKESAEEKKEQKKTMKQIAAEHGISETTLRKRIKNGQIVLNKDEE